MHPWATPIICAGLGFVGGAGVLLALVRLALRTPPDRYLWARIGELLEAEQGLLAARAQDQGQQQADDSIGQQAGIVAVRR